MNDDVEELGITKIERYHRLNRWLPKDVTFSELERWLGMGKLEHDKLHECDVFAVNQNLFFKIYY